MLDINLKMKLLICVWSRILWQWQMALRQPSSILYHLRRSGTCLS
jgi:hypothetical protein